VIDLFFSRGGGFIKWEPLRRSSPERISKASMVARFG